MKKLWSEIKGFIKDEDGQTSMEYILIIALVAAVIYKLGGRFSSKMNDTLDKSFNLVDKFTQNLE